MFFFNDRNRIFIYINTLWNSHSKTYWIKFLLRNSRAPLIPTQDIFKKKKTPPTLQNGLRLGSVQQLPALLYAHVLQRGRPHLLRVYRGVDQLVQHLHLLLLLHLGLQLDGEVGRVVVQARDARVGCAQQMGVAG